MKIRVLYFASLREAVGIDQESLDLPLEVRSLTQVRAYLCARGQPWADALATRRALRAAVDQVASEPDAQVHDGAEVAFFPPVTGG